MALNIQDFKGDITRLCERLKVKRLDVFGSATTEAFDSSSDVDVLVEFDRTEGNLFNRFFDLKEALESLFNRPVDLVVSDAIKNPYFKQTVEKSRENIYAA